MLKQGPWDRLNIHMSSYQYKIPLLKIRWSHHSLIFNMGIPYLGKTVFILIIYYYVQAVITGCNKTQYWIYDTVAKVENRQNFELKIPLCALDLSNTIRYRYNAINSLQNPCKRHPIARPLGWDIWWLLGLQIYSYSASVSAVMLTVSCNIGPCYNSTPLFISFYFE